MISGGNGQKRPRTYKNLRIYRLARTGLKTVCNLVESFPGEGQGLTEDFRGSAKAVRIAIYLAWKDRGERERSVRWLEGTSRAVVATLFEAFIAHSRGYLPKSRLFGLGRSYM